MALIGGKRTLLLRAASLGLLYGGASPLPIIKAAQAWFQNVIMLHFEILAYLEPRDCAP